MTIDLDKHIGVWDGVFSQEMCQNLIDYYEDFILTHPAEVQERDDEPLKISDTSVSASLYDKNVRNSVRLTRNLPELLKQIFNVCISPYRNAYPILKQLHGLSIYDMKIQKTSPGQGYHIWHMENAALVNRFRVCAFNVYLNTVDEGGETEFLSQGMRVKAEQGRVVLWPAYFTHPHRGNPPLSGDKYILTGWLESI